jgi:hypothetical protein
MGVMNHEHFFLSRLRIAAARLWSVLLQRISGFLHSGSADQRRHALRAGSKRQRHNHES